MEKVIISELNKLQDEFFDAYEGALHFKNKYHEYQDKYEKIKSKIQEKLKHLNEINPNHEYEVELEIIL